MTLAAAELTFAPQFLPGASGGLFALYVGPPEGQAVRQGVVYCPPFAEEMNKCRRMAVLQARRLAGLGYGVLVPDLYGTGDSAGDFGEASWERWGDDLEQAARHLQSRGAQCLTLWGVRLGALLAAHAVARLAPVRLVLWQPVAKGATYLTQFLRLRLAAQMMSGADGATVKTLREELAREGRLEVAGYDLARSLAERVESLDLVGHPPPAACAVHWFELAPGAPAGLSPASQRVIDGWAAAGASVQAATFAGEPFWQTPETAIAESLLEATTAALQGAGDA